jgi:hypothetical protein
MPHVPSIDTDTPDRGAVHAADELEYRAWQPPVVRQKVSPVPQ